MFYEKIKQRISSLFDRDREKYEFRPYGIWLFTLSSSAILALLIAWFGVWLFLDISSGRFFKESESTVRLPRDAIDKEKMGDVNAQYAGRQKLLDERKETRLRAQDPSL